MNRPIDRSADPGLRFDPLFRAHHDAIWRYCVRRLGPTDADDATADVFAVAWRRLDDIPGGDRARAWLYGVAYKVVGGRYRSRKRQTLLAARLRSVEEGESSDPVGDEHPSRELEVLQQAFDALGAADREILRLSTWDELSRSEIAYVLGLNENAVDQRLHRARSRLKSRIDRLDHRPSTEPEEASR